VPTRTRPRSTSRSRPWCRAPRPWRSPSCACRRSADEGALPAHGMCRGSIGGLRRQLVHNVKERGPPRGGPASIMTQLQEAGISPIAVNARRASWPNLRGCAGNRGI
jgi:hypothetical protein